MQTIIQYFDEYILFLGIALVLLALMEFVFPAVIFRIWKRWVNNKFFPFHGLILVAGGFPITQFRETFMGKIMLVIGLIVVFTGPFIIFFPDRIRHFFELSIKDLNSDELRHLVYVDGVMRLVVGIIFLFVMLTR